VFICSAHSYLPWFALDAFVDQINFCFSCSAFISVLFFHDERVQKWAISCPAAFVLLSSFLMTYGSVAAAALLQSEMLVCVFRAPTSFFDVTPLGRIINRFRFSSCSNN